MLSFKSHKLKEHGFPISIKYTPETANIKSQPLLLKTLISEASGKLIYWNQDKNVLGGIKKPTF